MIFEFLISIEKLHIPDFVFDHQLFQKKDWLFDKNQKPRPYYIELFKYGKNNFWDKR